MYLAIMKILLFTMNMDCPDRQCAVKKYVVHGIASSSMLEEFIKFQ